MLAPDESTPVSARVGTGIGIQLSQLRALARRIAKGKLLYYFTEDAKFKNDSNGKIVCVKKGYSFISKDNKLCVCEAIQQSFPFQSVVEIKDKFEERTFNQFTVQDISDLTQMYIRKNYSRGTALVNTSAIYSYCKGDPFDCAYVICPRDVNFNQFVASLNKHVQQKKVFVEEDDYYVWIDIFCSSLYQTKENTDETELKDNLCLMEEDIEKFSEVLIFFDSIREPLALRRLWCIWELYMASKVSETTPLSILFPSKISISTLILLDFDVLVEMVLGLDPMALESANSTASVAIRDLLTNLEEGFKTVIDSIKKTLCSWLTTLVIREYDTAQNVNKSLVLVTELYLDVGMFLINISGNARNARICKDKAGEVLDNKNFAKFFNDNDARILCETKRELLKEKILLYEGAIFISHKMSTFERKFQDFKDALKRKNFNVETFVGSNPNPKGLVDLVFAGKTTRREGSRNHTVTKIPTTNMLDPKTGISIQSSNSHVQSSKYLAGKFTDRRSNDEKVLDVQLQLLVAKRDYGMATKVMNVILNQYNQNENEITRLFGGLSAATLSFKFARQLFLQKNAVYTLQAQEQYKKALKFAKEGKVRIFIREKCAYYLALSFARTDSNSVARILEKNFFTPRGFSIIDVDINNPFIIGCTRRAAQVFFLLHAYAPANVIKKLGDGVFEKVGIVICKSLFGNRKLDEKKDNFEDYLEKLRDPIPTA